LHWWEFEEGLDFLAHQLLNEHEAPELVFALRQAIDMVDISRRMMELRGTSLQCGRRTLLSQQCNSINGMARLTSRQGSAP
jgi:hypothetical protein